MANFIIAISRRKVLFKFIAAIFLTYLAVFMFPIRYCRTGSLNLFLLFSSILIGLIFAAVYRLYWGKVLFLTMLSCTVGLGLRILMEWGEYTLDRDLTLINVLTTYIPVIAVIMISYFVTINSKEYLKVLVIESEVCLAEQHAVVAGAEYSDALELVFLDAAEEF